MNLKKSIIYIILFFFTTSCGFKVVNFNELLNFEINQINGTGNKYINYKIKNKLLKFTNNSKEKLVNIEFNTKKEKTIKERNIKNEITKYNLSILVDVKLNLVGQKESINFKIQESGDFTASKQYSQTLDSEKKLIETLVDKVYNMILENLINYSNEL
tara:strand:+ start:1273 stop:1746 length:474 start_codon:yes stop_codon:yes gene_type:complete